MPVAAIVIGGVNMLSVARLIVVGLAAGLGFGLAQLAAAQEPAPGNAPDGAGEAAFLAENEAAMTKMMSGMAIKPTGDVDRDFALMMIPHHQGAIDMVLAELRYGKNEQLRRLAQEIIVGQTQEIAVMRMAIGEPLPPSVPVPTQQPNLTQPAAPAAPMPEHHMPAR
jgi:Domain of unknown function (DUF305)